jgi:type I restriction enzyme S subunit
MWKTATLGSSCKMYQPKTISTKEMVTDGEYVVFGANGIIGRYHQYNHAEPQLLVTCRGATCGAVNVSDPFSWINGNAMVIQPEQNEVSLKYMEYVFRGGIDLSKAITGAAQPQITRKSLEPIKFSYPPLAEQQRIVAKLDAVFAEIDEAIDANSRNIINTNKLFEEHRNNIYEALLQNSKVTKVKEIANLSRGHNPPKSSFINEPRDGYVRFYQIRDAKSDKFATYVPNSDKLHLVNEKEFLMNAYRHIGEVFRGVNGAFNVALCKLTIKDFNKVCEDYLYYMIPSNLIKGELLKLSERSLIPSMSVKELAELNVPLPSFDKQEEVARNIENLKSKTQALNSIYQQKHAYFENLKSAVLAKELQSEAA